MKPRIKLETSTPLKSKPRRQTLKPGQCEPVTTKKSNFDSVKTQTPIPVSDTTIKTTEFDNGSSISQFTEKTEKVFYTSKGLAAKNEPTSDKTNFVDSFDEEELMSVSDETDFNEILMKNKQPKRNTNLTLFGTSNKNFEQNYNPEYSGVVRNYQEINPAHAFRLDELLLNNNVNNIEDKIENLNRFIRNNNQPYDKIDSSVSLDIKWDNVKCLNSCLEFCYITETPKPEAMNILDFKFEEDDGVLEESGELKLGFASQDILSESDSFSWRYNSIEKEANAEYFANSKYTIGGMGGCIKREDDFSQGIIKLQPSDSKDTEVESRKESKPLVNDPKPPVTGMPKRNSFVLPLKKLVFTKKALPVKANPIKPLEVARKLTVPTKSTNLKPTTPKTPTKPIKPFTKEVEGKSVKKEPLGVCKRRNTVTAITINECTAKVAIKKNQKVTKS